MQNKYWIFDYDGVIGNTIPHIIEFVEYYHNVNNDEAIKIIDKYASTPKHCKRTISSESYTHAEKWNQSFCRFLDGKYPPLYVGFIDALSQIENLYAAIVSNNSIQSINPEIHNYNIKFDPVLTFENGHSKEERIIEIVDLWGVDLSQVNYLTDTNSDVLEILHTLPFGNVYCCTWGWNDFNEAAIHLPANNILREYRDILHAKINNV
jgi:FMN phosphatase YigB (HAD superfamily)